MRERGAEEPISIEVKRQERHAAALQRHRGEVGAGGELRWLLACDRLED